MFICWGILHHSALFSSNSDRLPRRRATPQWHTRTAGPQCLVYIRAIIQGPVGRSSGVAYPVTCGSGSVRYRAVAQALETMIPVVASPSPITFSICDQIMSMFAQARRVQGRGRWLDPSGSVKRLSCLPVSKPPCSWLYRLCGGSEGLHL